MGDHLVFSMRGVRTVSILSPSSVINLPRAGAHAVALTSPVRRDGFPSCIARHISMATVAAAPVVSASAPGRTRQAPSQRRFGKSGAAWHERWHVHAQKRAGRLSARPACAAAAAAQTEAKTEADVVIVGGGLAGLCAAKTLTAAGVDFVLLEGADAVGGRLRTDVVEGFLLDRGFAIFLTGYPEAQRVLDYAALDLQPFYAGADVRFEGDFHRVADPLRHPVDAVLSLSPSHPVGSPIDKVLVGVVRLQSLIGDCYDILSAPETTIMDRLKGAGFSDAIIGRFFRPFMSGIFFNPALTTSSRLFNFVMRMLATGQNCLPSKGIEEVARQLERALPAGAVRCGTKATAVVMGEGRERVIEIEGGGAVTAKKALIVATEGPGAAALLGEPLAKAPSANGAPVGTTCLYFAIDGPAPLATPILYLNGDGPGLINNCCFPSTVAPSYAPAGKTLVSVSVIGVPEMTDEELETTVRRELEAWFGKDAKPAVSEWRHLKTYRIPFAQPNQIAPTDLARTVDLGEGLYVCGDHRAPATFDGAMISGRLAAEAAIAKMK